MVNQIYILCLKVLSSLPNEISKPNENSCAIIDLKAALNVFPAYISKFDFHVIEDATVVINQF